MQARQAVRGRRMDRFRELALCPQRFKSHATGFHSLVELLVRAEPSSQLKNRALRRALSHKRLDLIELLVSHGAEINSVPFIEVLMLWDPTIIRYFLDHGADFITGYPFAEAFAEKIRTAL